MNEWLETIQTEGLEFLCGRTFIIATVVFLIYLFLTGILKRIKNWTVGTVVAIIGFFSPLKLRRLLFNTMSLIFMVFGAAFCCWGSAKLSRDTDGILEAIVGGSGALTIWGFVMLLANQFRSTSPKREYEEEDSGDRKVRPPSSLIRSDKEKDR